MSNPNLTVNQLKRAITVAEQIEKLQNEMASILGNQPAAKAAGPGRPKGAPKAAGGKMKRTMSPEARAKIAAAQRARWAKVKPAGGKAKPAAKAAPAAKAKPAPKAKVKRNISPESRARMVEGAKKRWEAKRAAAAAPAAPAAPVA